MSFKQFFTVSIFIDVVVSNPVIVLSSSKMEKTYTFVSASFDDNHLSLSISSATRQFLACNKLLNFLISHVLHLFPICRWCPAHDHSPPMNTQRNYGKRTPRACKYAPNNKIKGYRQNESPIVKTKASAIVSLCTQRGKWVHFLYVVFQRILSPAMSANEISDKYSYSQVYLPF